MLLRFAHQVQMFGPWPAIRKNLARVRGVFVLFLVAVGVAGRLRGEFSWTDVIATAVVMYILLWGLVPGVCLALRWLGRRLPAGRFVWQPMRIAIAAIWRHIFGKTPDLRGSRVSRWSVMEAVLVLAVTLFIGVPYCIGAAHARIQAVYGLDDCFRMDGGVNGRRRPGSACRGRRSPSSTRSPWPGRAVAERPGHRPRPGSVPGGVPARAGP
jgi:hypothetical protein